MSEKREGPMGCYYVRRLFVIRWLFIVALWLNIFQYYLSTFRTCCAVIAYFGRAVQCMEHRQKLTLLDNSGDLLFFRQKKSLPYRRLSLFPSIGELISYPSDSSFSTSSSSTSSSSDSPSSSSFSASWRAFNVFSNPSISTALFQIIRPSTSLPSLAFMYW